MRASLVAPWQIIHLPMQETWVWTLVQEDPTGQGAVSLGTRARARKPPEPTGPLAQAPQREAPQWEACALQLERSPFSNQDSAQPKIDE